MRWVRWIARPFADPLALLLIATGIGYAILGNHEDAAIAAIVLIPVVSVSLILEARSDRALERLRRLAAPSARVWRAGARSVVPAAALVPGDVIDIGFGDIIPADAELIGVEAPLTIDESLLTGESQPIVRSAGGAATVYAGTSVLAGSGTARVTATGRATRAGDIARLLEGARQPPTPLERAIRRLAFWLAAVAAGACAAIVGIELGRGAGWGTALIAGVTLAMAAVPEEFPMVYTLYLSVGAWRLTRQHALVRRLAAVETLGSATVICADKTGTLTYGRGEIEGVAGDVLRPGVVESIEECRQAQIRVVLVTGDYAAAARTVAERLGLLESGAAIITGDDVDQMDAAALGAVVRTHNVFARMLPEQKHRIVRSLQAQGEIVAMTGDGVNDAPALRDADIGIALGAHGTDVARQAAKLVLLDDNFATIVHAVRNGRRIADNLQAAFAYLIAIHIPMLLTTLVVPLVGAALVLLPIHVVWIELVVHPTSALVFEADPGAPDLMRRPPRPASAHFLRGIRPGHAAAVGALIGGAVLTVYFALAPSGVAHARSVAFATLLLGQVGLVLVARSPRVPVWRSALRGNRLLLPVEALTLASLLVALLVAPVRHALALAPLAPGDWALALGAAVVATFSLEWLKR